MNTAVKLKPSKIILRKKSRLKLDASLPKLTDQSDAKDADINAIMERYKKTGMLPQYKEKIGQYLDNTQIPTFMDAHDLVVQAQELFLQIPSPIRKLMDNDPANLENFIKNKDNHDILREYGVLNKVEPSQKVDPPTAKAAGKSSKDEDSKE